MNARRAARSRADVLESARGRSPDPTWGWSVCHGNEALAHRDGGRLGAIRNFQLFNDAVHMISGRIVADSKDPSDFLIREAFRHKLQYLMLSRGQIRAGHPF